MRQKRRLIRSDPIARNLLWMLVLLILVCVVLMVRNCHAGGWCARVLEGGAVVPFSFLMRDERRGLHLPNL
jgi:hypothetical protein